jgi:peptidoglycan/xylan/chitin deacetylase (PgdA/CDA1 family)
MPADGVLRSPRLARTMAGRRRNRPVVLAYHRIAHSASDPQLLSVTPENFAEHLRLIGEQHKAVTLPALVAAASEGRPMPRAVAVTFDDGYADNLLLAQPLLERRGVPATVFVTSRYVRDGRPFWWDELERLLLSPGVLPSSLTLGLGRETLCWKLGSDASYTKADLAARAAWNVLDARDPGPRQRVYRALVGRLRALDEPERDDVLDRLRAVVRLDGRHDGETPRPLTPDELVRLGQGEIIQIGAHTETHPVLSKLTVTRQRQEVMGSKRELEDALGRPVSAFAYPYGGSADFDDTTISLVGAAGFHHACSSVPGRVGHRSDRWRIPRLVVRNWTGDELERRLSRLAR